MQSQQIDRETSVQVVVESLRVVLDQSGEPIPSDITEDTVLVGANAVLDSLGVVSLIVEVEQRLELDYNVSLTLANDRAMSQRNSPFRTIGVLADYIGTLLTENQQ